MKKKSSNPTQNQSTESLDSQEKTLKESKPHNAEVASNLWNAPNVLLFVESKLGVKLDDWQKEYIQHKGNTAVRAGRQSGKSFAESIRITLFALLNPKTTTIIIASVDRQSIELLEKVKSIITRIAGSQIAKRPTFHKIELKNGSEIYALPAGTSGYGLRGFTVHKLVADEAHYIQDAVFVAVRPMLATTNGTLDLLSTPRGNTGFFYDCFKDENFHQIHIKSENCPRITKEFLDQERRRMTKLEYCQEYEAEFLDSLQQFFTEKLITSCLVKEWDTIDSINYLGVDFSGHGLDPNAFVTLANKNKCSYVKSTERTEDQKAWETVNHIKDLNSKNNYKKIGVDDGGLGSPILDYMLKDSKLKRKAVGLNNATRDIDADGKTKSLKGLEMHANLKIMMEQGTIKINENDDLMIRSLMSIQLEIDDKTKNIKIHGKHDHEEEALKRAAWLVKTKGLNIMAFC